MSLVLLLVMGVTPSPIQAQDRPFPYELKHRDLLMAPLALGMTMWGESLREGTDPILPGEVASLRPEDVNWFDRTATDNWSDAWNYRSDGFRDIVVFGGLALAGVEAANQLFRGEASNTATLVTMGVEMTLYTMGATYMTKALVGRKRPYMYNTDLSLQDRIARVKAGVHYPTDVIAGAIAGSAIGYLVPRLHRKEGEGRLGLVVSPTRMGLRLRF